MGSAFHQLCPRHSGTLTPTAPTAIKLWDTFTFFTSAFSVYEIGLHLGNGLLLYGSNMFFHVLTFARSRGSC